MHSTDHESAPSQDPHHPLREDIRLLGITRLEDLFSLGLTLDDFAVHDVDFNFCVDDLAHC